jgi:16S rRNA (guanine1516-N2)-methyltransferase
MISVLPSSPEFRDKAAELATRLELPLNEDVALLLVVGERLELREAGAKTGPVFVDFRQRQHYQKELIAKAVGVKGDYRPTVLDTTAGLGQDAFVLASYGCKVKMLERSKVVHALLEDSLRRAKEDKDLTEVISRIGLECADAKTVLNELASAHYPEVIYLDPMYPDLGKSAAKRKEMRLFRELVGDDTDVAELFALALGRASKRVVVKRPLKAPELGKPNFKLVGKTVRFDVYLINPWKPK